MSGTRDRLGRQGAAAAALLAGLIGVIVLAVGFTALLDDALEGDGVAEIDQPAAHWLATHREGWLNTSLTLLHPYGRPTGTDDLATVPASAAWRIRSPAMEQERERERERGGEPSLWVASQ